MSNKPIFSGFQRLQNFPLTDAEVFDTIDALEEYVSTNPTAYVGQVCVVKGIPSKTYIINEDKSISGSNTYVHPATHPASIIEQDTNNRFVTDAEKSAWNSKQPAGSYLVASDIAVKADISLTVAMAIAL